MDTSPVQLDFSKAQPIQEQTQPDPSANVNLDFSKAQPLDQSQSNNTPAPNSWRSNPVVGVASGVGGAALDTLYHLGSAVVDPVSGAAGRITGNKVGDSSQSLNPLSAFTKEAPDELQNKSTAEKAGGFGEGVGEFVAGGEVADVGKLLTKGSKGLEFLMQHPHIASIVEQGLVGGAQAGVHGENVAEGAAGGAAGGAIGEGVGAALGKFADLAPSRTTAELEDEMAKPTQTLYGTKTGVGLDVAGPGSLDPQERLNYTASTYGVPLSAGQKSGSKSLNKIGMFLGNLFGGKGELNKLTSDQYEALRKAGTSFGEVIGSDNPAAEEEAIHDVVKQRGSLDLDPRAQTESTKQVAYGLKAIKQQVDEWYGTVVGQVQDAAQELTIPMTDLKTAAEKVLEEVQNGAGLRDVQGTDPVRQLLRSLTQSDPVDMPGGTYVPREISWQDAFNIKRSLQDIAYSGESTVSKGQIKTVVSSIDNALYRSLEDSGDRGLAAQLRQANHNYAQVQRGLEDGYVGGILGKGGVVTEPMLNSIAPAIVGPNGMFHLQNILKFANASDSDPLPIIRDVLQKVLPRDADPEPIIKSVLRLNKGGSTPYDLASTAVNVAGAQYSLDESVAKQAVEDATKAPKSSGNSAQVIADVRRGVWDYLWNQAVDPATGKFSGDVFKRQLGTIDDGIKTKLFGYTPGLQLGAHPGPLDSTHNHTLWSKVLDFANLVDTVTANEGITKNAQESASGLKTVGRWGAGVLGAGEVLSHGIMGLLHAMPGGIAIAGTGAGAIKLSSKLLLNHPDALMDASRLMRSAIAASKQEGITVPMWEKANRTVLTRLSKMANAFAPAAGALGKPAISYAGSKSAQTLSSDDHQ